MKISLKDNDSAIYWHKRSGCLEEVRLYQAGGKHEDALYVLGFKGTITDVHPGDLILYLRGQRTFEVWPMYTDFDGRHLAVIAEFDLMDNDAGLYVYVRDLKQ